MDHQQYQTQDPNAAGNPMGGPQQQQPGTGTTRGRGRRAYAAQQYDFNAPAVPPAFDQQQQYSYPPAGQAFAQQQQQQPAATSPQSQYPQQAQQAYPQQYQYGPEYGTAAGSPTAGYQQPYPGQPGVGGMTQQFGQMHVSQVPPSPAAHLHIDST
jgi:hypothetical protein